MSTATYDLKAVRFAVDGVPVGDFANGDAVTIEWDEDSWTKTVGASGGVVRSRSGNNTGKITFRLLPSSPLNRTWSDLKARDDRDGDGVVTIYIEDLRSGTKVQAPEAWIMKEPSLTYGQTAQEAVEWVFDTGQMTIDRRGIPPAILNT